MDVVLQGAHAFADKLLDDIIVWTNDFDTHMKHLTDVLNRLRAVKLTLNVKKCTLATDKLRIFGSQVKNGLIMSDADKTSPPHAPRSN